MKTFGKALLIGVVTTLLVSSSVLAAYAATITVTESGSNSYDMLPVSVTMDNSALVGDYYITSTGLDTKVLDAGTPLPHMLASDRTMFALPVSADTQYQLTYSTGNAALDSFYTIVGYNGYITVSDDATLEIGDNFEFEWKGYLDTDSGYDKYLLHKPAAFSVSISDTEEITAGIVSSEDRVNITPSASLAWTDVDVTAYVPAGSSGVILECESAGPLTVGVRKNGSTDDNYRDEDLRGHQSMMVGIDEGRKFEAYLEDHNNSTIYLIGYTDDSWVFKTNWVDIDANTTASWTEDDITSDTSADADVAVFYIQGHIASGAMEWGLRTSGSSDTIKYDVDGGNWNFGIVGLSSEQAFDYYNEDSDIDFILVGYAESGSTLPADKVDKEPSAYGVWEDVDCSTEASSANALFFELGGNSPYEYSIIPPFDVDSSYEEYYSHAFAISFCGADQIVQAKVEAITSATFHYVGHSTSGMHRISQEITYLKSVTAINVTSGNHTVETWADAVNLYISIDSAVAGDWYDSIALAAATVPDNTNDWYLDRGNVMPYMEYYKHTVSDTQILWYQPNTMIIGTVLPDREVDSGTADDGTTTTLIDDALTEADDYWNNVTLEILTTTDGEAPQGESAIITDFVAVDDELQFDALTAAVEVGDTYELRNDGVFMWGSNPSGIAASVGALLPETQAAADVTTDAEAPSFAPETSDESWFETGIEGEGLPFYDLFKGLLDTYKDLGGADISMPYFWKIVAVLAGLMFGTFILLTTRSTLVGAAGYIIGFVVPATMGVLDWWLVIVYMMGAIPLCILSTKWHAI